MSLIFERILTDGIAAISYLIGDDEEGTAAVIDPRPDVELLNRLADDSIAFAELVARRGPMVMGCVPPHPPRR